MKYTVRLNSITFRANSQERVALEIMATQEGRNISDMVRQAIREAAQARHLPELGVMAIMNEVSPDSLRNWS